MTLILYCILVIEKKRNQDKPGPGMYLDRSNIDYFSNEIRFNSGFTNPKRSSFGGEKRFSFPSKCQINGHFFAKKLILI